ncbi:MAG: hypothetical protein FWC20_06770 [Oscillospiraceae bacterium]|nr:hypothetical protein [Oscillospiraceae bacterium]MCL2279093.1 hypothetical protein [Oscillospiraceae bacterium]
MKNKAKFPAMPIFYIICGIVAGAIVWGVITTYTGIRIFPHTEANAVCAETAGNAELANLAYTVLENIRDDNFLALSEVVHPQFGVTFTPYTTINLTTDRRFSAAEVQSMGTDTTIYIWGVRNGSGEPISLTPSEFIEQFVPAEDFLDAALVGINKIVRSGNALENIKEVFPEVRFVDFHLTGSDEDILGIDDWRSLRLGFEEYQGGLKLIAIIHSTWTA